MTDKDDKHKEEEPENSSFSSFLRYDKGARSKKNEAINGESHGQYLFGVGYEDTSDDEIKQANWTSYTTTRMVSRLFSRGIMGASFYAVGQAAIRKQMPGYHPGLELTSYDAAYKPLRYIARFVDRVIAPPIKAFARNVPLENAEMDREYLAERLVTFRNKAYFPDYPKTLHNPDGSGYSLGHEIVSRTFDFAMGSIGDSWGRQIVNACDPNITNSWNKDGHFDGKQFLRASAQQAWKILTKSQGEDWAASLPYVYQMKWQRQALNRASPGFKVLSDRGVTGWGVNKEGQIISSFMPAHALDLQLRFTGYNFYTAMYRDMYDEVADYISDYREEGALPKFHMPEEPLREALGGVANVFRYILKTGIKTSIWMMPSVPFFWTIRAPQGKYKGIGQYIDISDGHREDSGIVKGPDGNPYNYFQHNEMMKNGGQVTLNGRVLPNSSFNKDFFPHGPATNPGVFDRLLDWNGKQCYRAGDGLFRALRRAGVASTAAHRDYVHDWVNASAAYTPYMIAKTETALRWDKPILDRAIYRLIDGAASFRYKEVKGALSDIREQIIHPASPNKLQQFQLDEEKREETLEQQKEEYRQAKRSLSAAPDTRVAEVTGHALAQKEPEHDHHSPIATRNPKADWVYRSDTRHLGRDLEVPPGASIH